MAGSGCKVLCSACGVNSNLSRREVIGLKSRGEGICLVKNNFPVCLCRVRSVSVEFLDCCVKLLQESELLQLEARTLKGDLKSECCAAQSKPRSVEVFRLCIMLEEPTR